MIIVNNDEYKMVASFGESRNLDIYNMHSESRMRIIYDRCMKITKEMCDYENFPLGRSNEDCD
jgi:hypothetical protein